MKTSPQTRAFVVDREQGVIRDTNDSTLEAVILQTQVGLLRNEAGRIIGCEVLHYCEAAGGFRFVLDETTYALTLVD